MELDSFAEVAVFSPAKASEDRSAFTYALPEELEGRVDVGSLVVVPFGSRRLYGVVMGLSDRSPVAETRPIESLVDPRPVLNPKQIALARWLADEYLASLHECLDLMLPPGMIGHADIKVALSGDVPDGAAKTEAQGRLLALLQQRGPLRGSQLSAALRGVDWRATSEQLARRHVVTRESFLAPPGAEPKRVETIRLTASNARVRAFFEELSTSKQADALELLVKTAGHCAALDTICEAVACTKAVIQTLSAKGWVKVTPAVTMVSAEHALEEIDQFIRDSSSRAPAQASVLSALVDGPRPTHELPHSSYSILRSLEKKGLIARSRQPRTAHVALSIPEAEAEIAELRNIDPYPAVVTYLRSRGGAAHVKLVYGVTGCTRYHLNKLEERGLVAFGTAEVWRDPLANEVFVPTTPPPLTTDQQTVWETVQMATAVSRFAAFLLHGVTGSGKTEIYLRAVAQVLEQERKAIVLVPEISLTPQTVDRFGGRFPDRVAVLHSALTEGERYDTWRRIRDDALDVVIGPRSALFAPLSPLGLIVLDEEHDDSYKQEAPRPRYHAREAALELARLHGATVILGSATPSLESFHRASRGAFTLQRMPRRIMGHARRIQELQARYQVPRSHYRPLNDKMTEARYLPLPPVQVVDLRAELRAGNRSIFSRALQLAMDEALSRGEQVILFLNRRGTATFVLCRDCGYVARCPRCDVPLTYHGPRALLVCHHCNHRAPQPQGCPACGGKRIRYFGLGTERLEQTVRARWPEARLLRWDRDTAHTHAAHANILRRFASGAADVLVGTQMITKGLDLPLVTVVGVISADTALNLPDFRSGERTFQLLTQVAGRAGRGLLAGRVVVQTYHPDHYAVDAASRHDYEAFADHELAFRRAQGYPPFSRLVKLVYENTNDARAQARAEQLADLLADALAGEGLPLANLMGPAPPFFARLRGRYRWQILLRHPSPAAFLRGLQIPPGWRVEVDPVSVL